MVSRDKNTNSNDIQPKRKRGRPKKNKQVEEPLILFDGEEFNEDQQDTSVYTSYTSDSPDTNKFYSKIGRTKVLSQEEEVLLFKELEKNPENKVIREQIIKYNMRLVCSVARKYCKKGVDFEDLVQEGTFGLIRAIEKFDYMKGFKFSTYATWWIQQSIKQSINKTSRIIRLPSHIIEKYQLIRKTKEEYLKKNNQEISYEQLSEKIDLPIKKIRQIEKVTQPTYSLDFVMSNTDGGKDDSVVNYYVHDDKAQFENQVANDMDKNMLLTLISNLDEKEQIVLKYKYQLENIDLTTDDFCKKYNIEKNKIKQIEKTALKKLRKLPELLKLKKELV